MNPVKSYPYSRHGKSVSYVIPRTRRVPKNEGINGAINDGGIVNPLTCISYIFQCRRPQNMPLFLYLALSRSNLWAFFL